MNDEVIVTSDGSRFYREFYETYEEWITAAREYEKSLHD